MRVYEIVEAAPLPHQLAIDDHGEVNVQDDVVVDGESEHDADQRELCPFYSGCDLHLIGGPDGLLRDPR